MRRGGHLGAGGDRALLGGGLHSGRGAPDVEGEDGGARRRRQLHVGVRDGPDAAVHHLDAHLRPATLTLFNVGFETPEALYH